MALVNSRYERTLSDISSAVLYPEEPSRGHLPSRYQINPSFSTSTLSSYLPNYNDDQWIADATLMLDDHRDVKCPPKDELIEEKLADPIPAEFENDSVLEEHICVITQAPIRYPLAFTSKINGHTYHYEAHAIRRWVMEKGKDPQTREPVTLDDLKKDVELQNKIENRLDELMPRRKLLRRFSAILDPLYPFFAPVINVVNKAWGFLKATFNSLFSTPSDKKPAKDDVEGDTPQAVRLLSLRQIFKTLFSI